MIEYNLSEQTEIPTEGDFSVKVIGVGGAGANVLDRMALEGSDEAELLTLNTDVRALSTSVSNNKIQLGSTLLKGMGAGGDPELGRQGALEAIDDIRAAVRGYKMAFVCVGLGGGTGSGAAPEVCRVAKEEGVFLVVFATLPFSFEGKRRMDQALDSLDRISRYANAVVTFENDRMGELIVPKDGVQQAFAAADKVISQSIRATMSIVFHPGIIRIGMDELLSALDNKNSRCLFGFGQAKGDSRAHEALEQALKSPLLDKGKLLENASNVLVHVGGGGNMTLFEVELVMQELGKHIDDANTQILFGTGTDENLGSSLTVTIISSLSGPKGGGPDPQRESNRDPAPEPDSDGPDDAPETPPRSTSPLAGAAAAFDDADESEAESEAEEEPEAEAETETEAIVEEEIEEIVEEVVEDLESAEPEEEIEEEIEEPPEVEAIDEEADGAAEEEEIEEAAEEEKPVVEADAEAETEDEGAAGEEEAGEPAPISKGAAEAVTEPVVSPKIIQKKVIESSPVMRKPVVEIPKKPAPKITIAAKDPSVESDDETYASIKMRPPGWSDLESNDTIGKLLQQGQMANAPGGAAATEEEAADEESKAVSIRDLARQSREESAGSDEDAIDEVVEEIAEEEKVAEEEMIVAETGDSQKITLSRLVPGSENQKTKPIKVESAQPSAEPIEGIAGQEEGEEMDAVTAQQQQMLQLEPLSKGRFSKTEPTVIDGEDMDVPTFLRKRRK